MPTLSSQSVDPLLTLRRVERQQRLVELLVARGASAAPTSELAADLAVSPRTVERDLARLRESGVPVRSRRGRGGGSWFDGAPRRRSVDLEAAEVVALLASMVALGPTATDSAASATRKLVAALQA